MIRLYRPAHRAKVRAGAHLGQRLFDEQADLRPGGQRIHHIDTAGGIPLLTGIPCDAGRVVAAGEAAGDGKRQHIAAVAEGLLPIRDIGTRTVRTALRTAKHRDHLIYIEGGIVAEFLRVGANGKGNADELYAVQRKNITAGICNNTDLVHRLPPSCHIRRN